MTTTVNLDPDTEELLQLNMRQRGITLDEALNDAVRAGIRKPFVQKTFAMGNPLPGVNMDKALSLAFELEDEELLKKMGAHE